MRSLTRHYLCVLVCLAAGVVILSVGKPGTMAADQKPSEPDPVKSLLKDRVAVLAKIHEITQQGFKGGEISYDKVLSAQTALLTGKLDLCETNAERVKAHEDLVKLAEEMRSAVQKLVENRSATRVHLIKADVHLLEARIGLEKAKVAK
jgi:outer membrane protein TolC